MRASYVGWVVGGVSINIYIFIPFFLGGGRDRLSKESGKRPSEMRATQYVSWFGGERCYYVRVCLLSSSCHAELGCFYFFLVSGIIILQLCLVTLTISTLYMLRSFVQIIKI